MGLFALMQLARRMLRGNDVAKAKDLFFQRKLSADAMHSNSLSGFRRTMEGLSSLACPKIKLGTARDHEGNEFEVVQTIDDFFNGHQFACGSSGSGKTFLIIKKILDLLTIHWGAVVIIDYKGELSDLLLNTFMPAFLQSLPDADRERMLPRFVTINPFSEDYLPEFNVLKKNPSMPLNIHVTDVLSAFEKMTEDHLGMRQDVIMKYLLMLAIEKNLTFLMIKDLIENPFFLESMVSGSAQKEVRNYFRLRFKRENKSSIDSLLSRIDRLLFLDHSRLMFSARGCLDFNELLTDKITIVNLGSAPFGYEDFAKFWGTFILTKIIRSIFHRRVDDNTHSAWIAVDEWTNLLTAAQADQMEKVLSMARFKKCYFSLICQQMGQVAKVSRSLPKITITNTNKQYFFRSNCEDAKYFSYALPVTGKMPKPKENIWDPGEKIEYYSHAEEIRALIEQVTQLPNRQFFYLDKTKPYKAQLVKSAYLDIREAKLKADTADERIKNLLQKGSLCQPVSLLKEVLEERKKEMKSMCNMQPCDGDEYKRKQTSSYIEPPVAIKKDKENKKGPRVNLG